jgi:replication factor C small subunit
MVDFAGILWYHVGMEENIEWVDKYRPQTLDDVVISDELRKTLKGMVKNGNLLNSTFCGTAGIGKTTIARVLCNEIDATVLFIPCATDGTVDVIRSRIRSFCETMSMKDSLKVVILDEIDSSSSSGQNNFQMALRTVIEEFQKDTRFILTCNFLEKITVKPILSRCPVIKLDFQVKDLVVRLKHILDSEKIKYTNDTLKEFLLKAVSFIPDIRRIVKYAQFCSMSGTLEVMDTTKADVERMKFAKDLVKSALESKDLLQLRQFYVSHKAMITDWKEMASDIYSYVLDQGIVKDFRKVLKMSDILYQMNVVINPEVQFFALLTLINSEKTA